MLKELGEYKNRLRSIFVNDDNICKLLLGQDYEGKFSDLDAELDNYIIPHQYMPTAVLAPNSYIMFETYVTKCYRKIKTIKIVIQAICHKDMVTYKEKPTDYFGLRYDVLAEFIEELLCPENDEQNRAIIKKFGIGSISLESVDIFLSNDFIGHTLTFTVPDFR